MYKRQAQKSGSWIFTSATLSVNDDLHHFTARLGIDEAQTLLLPRPFDYQHQACLLDTSRCVEETGIKQSFFDQVIDELFSGLHRANSVGR